MGRRVSTAVRHRWNREGLCRLLWRLWSPTWEFDDATYARSAAAFDNPDFVDVVIHSYRHRHGLVAGDPALADIEARLAAQPDIAVPAKGDMQRTLLAGAARAAAGVTDAAALTALCHGSGA